VLVKKLIPIDDGANKIQDSKMTNPRFNNIDDPIITNQ